MTLEHHPAIMADAMAQQTQKREKGRRPRLTVNITPGLKRRIKVAAAAQDLPVSTYVTDVLERAVPANGAPVRATDGAISAAMIRRADRLRAQQKEAFAEDSADLIREDRRRRYDEL